MLADESTPLPCGPPVIQERSLTLILDRLIALPSCGLVVSDGAIAAFDVCAIGTCALTTVHLIIAIWAGIDQIFSGQNQSPAQTPLHLSFDIRLHAEPV